MAADKRVNVIVAGDSSGAQKALQDVGDKAESSAKRAGSAFSTVAQTLTGAGGGAFSAVSETLEGVSRGIDVVGEHGHSAGAKLLGLGAAGVAAGTMLMTAASDDIQAHQQLEQAIQNTGDTIDDFSGRIDALDGHFQNFGYASETTEQALRVLVQSTGDTGKAIDTMAVAADLAKAKHEGLTEAATQLSVILGGKGGRTLQQFGINLDEFKGKSDAGALAVQALADKLQGQAAAASDTFTGKLQAAKAKIEDFVGEVGQSYGPAITGIASATTLAGGAVEGFGAVMSKVRGTTTEAAAATEALSVAQGEAAVTGEALAIAEDSAMGPLGIVLGVAAAGATAFALLRGRHDDVAEAAKKMGDAVRQAASGIDVQAAAADSAASANKHYGDVLQQTAQEVTQKGISSNDDYLQGLKALGLQYKDLAPIVSGQAGAEQALEQIRRRSLETGAIVLQQGGKHYDINSKLAQSYIKNGTEVLKQAAGMDHADAVQGKYGEDTAKLIQYLERQSAAAQKVTEHTIAQAAAGDETAAAVVKSSAAWATLTDAQRTNIQATLDQAAAQAAEKAAADDAKVSFDTTQASILGVTLAQQGGAAAAQAQKDAFDQLNGATSGVAGGFAAAKETANEFKIALDTVHDTALSLFDSETKVAKATDDLSAALKTDGDNLDVNSAKTDAQRGKIEDLRDKTSAAANAALDHATAMVKSGSSADDAQKYIDDFTASLDDQFRKAGANDQQIADMNRTLGLTPENKATTLLLFGQEQAKALVDDYLNNHLGAIKPDVMTQIQAAVDRGDVAEVQHLIDLQNQLHDKTVSYTINTVTSGGPGYHPPAAAAAGGGSFDTGAEVLVGELGPERVIFGQPGTVIPHGQSALGGGVNITNHFTIQGNVYADDLGAQIEAHLGSVVQQAMAGAR